MANPQPQTQRNRASCYVAFLDNPNIVNAALGPGFISFCVSVWINAICIFIHVATPVPAEAPDSCTGDAPPVPARDNETVLVAIDNAPPQAEEPASKDT